MMKGLFFLLIFFLLTACSRDPSNDSGVQVIEEKGEAVEPYLLSENDKLHIDFVQYLEESDEYALTLHFKEETDVKFWYDSIEQKLDELLFTDSIEFWRYRIPDSLVQQYFMTDRLKQVKLYDENNAFCGVARFSGFEFINQNIEPKCVAVFKLSSKNENALYAVAGLKKVLPEIPPEELSSTTRLNELKRQYLPFNYKDDNSMQSGFQDTRLYAVQGYEKDGFAVYASLFLEANGKVSKVHHLEDSWLYWGIHPLAIAHEGNPLLLCDIGKFETCWRRSMVLKYSKGKYSEPRLGTRL